ncbi:MAG: PQQ-dependent sugar dehydrogenase [Caldilineae bacterium]|nr:PQQ-dependent sugar dehydrogenase [Caldilineae bacterium]
MRALKWPVLIAVLFVVVAGAMSRIASASAGGRVGFSGNPATNAGQTCTACHSAGAATPVVDIAGPAIVDAGSTHSYVVTVAGGPGVTGGFNASTTGFLGTFSSVDAETEVLAGEITHNNPKFFSGGQVQFTFDWTAPDSNGPVTMYAAGNSTNGEGNLAGDGVNNTSMTIVVQNGSPNPTPTPVPPPASITLQQVASGLSQPVVITNAFDKRLFVVERAGRIRIIDATGSLLATPFLDITSQVDSSDGEQGLLGLAFHPNYVNNGYFYVYYTYDPPGTNNDRTRISRFTRNSGNANLANPASELVLMEFEQPFGNHNAGDMHFGEDGYLYIASGDGGGSYWASVGQVPPMMFSQGPDDLLGKILRIDVDTPAGVDTGPDCNIAGGTNYSIPPGNAFTNGAGNGCDEIWAFGVRNPWRFSFDRADGSGWIADVGQSEWEEVNRFAAGTVGGLNYGWSCREGTHAASEYYNFYDYTLCQPASAYDEPAYELSHSTSDCSITGGFVYRGTQYLDLPGAYFFSDYCRPSIRTLTGSPDNLAETTVLPTGSIASPSTFGEDVLGELYVASLSSGTVSRIAGSEPRPTTAVVSKTLSAPAIDGVIDAAWDGATEYTMNNNLVIGTGVLFQSDLWATWRALYDDDNLYFLVTVRDDTLIQDGPNWYDDDIVEIMIDGDHSRGSSYDGVNDFELGFRWNDPSIIRGANSAPVPPGAQFSMVGTGDGYVLEVLVPLDEIDVQPVDDYTFGFDIHVNDDDDGGARDAKFTWFGVQDNGWQAPMYFSDATLDDGSAPPAPVAAACYTQSILFVAATLEPSLAVDDLAVVNHLRGLGYTVTVQDDNFVQTSDANGRQLVIISSSVTSTNIGFKFTSAPVAVITWEDSLYDELRMTLDGATGHGIQTAQQVVTVAGGQHPLTAGLSGPITASDPAAIFSWGAPTASAIQAATLSGDNTKAAIFGYDTGAAMTTLNAPARRVGFLIGTANFTGNGWSLFDAAVNWALECGVVNSFSLVNGDTNQILGTLHDGDNLELTLLPPNLKIRANIAPALTGSVVFTYDGSPTTDNSAPYEFLGGPLEWTPATGPHTLSARAFSQADGGGLGTPAQTINFTVTNTPLAVTLASFQAAGVGDHIAVSWETVSEIDNTGFNLYRGTGEAGPDEMLAFIASAAPGSAQGASYSFADRGVQAGVTYWYWLEALEVDGNTAMHGPVSALAGAPTAVSLSNVVAGSDTTNLLWLVVVAAGLALAAAYGLRRNTVR